MNLITLEVSQRKNYFSILLAFLPIGFIAGNLIININIILLIFSSLIFFGKDLFKIKYYFLDKLIFSLFIFIIITGCINDYHFYSIQLAWKGYFATIIKSIFFLKYLLLYLILRFLIEKEILDLKFLFISSTFASLFVCFDIFYQLFNGQDIFGLKPIGRKLSGPFGDELIAGGFIQRFSIFAFFLIPFFYSKNLNKFLRFLIPVLFLIFFTGVILSGNRMPLILYIFSIFLIIIFQKQTRKYLLSFIFIFLTIFFLTYKLVPQFKDNARNFYFQVAEMSVMVLEKDFYNKQSPYYLKEFVTFYDTWLMHKYLGGGIKNFRYYCHHRKDIDINSEFICNMHPHNYYLEILTETGLIGFSIIICIFLLTLYISFFKKYFSKSSLQYNNLIIPFIFLFIVEIFPIKSTGSFFTTGNATYLFLIMSILIGLARKYNSIENKS